MPSANTKPWYLTDMTESLYVDPVSGEVAVRTGINGNVNITGPVTIPGTVTVNSSAADPVHVHLDEVGTSGILNVPYLPIGGNVNVTGGNVNAAVTGNVVVTSGNINAVVTGTVGISGNIAGNVNANVTGGNIIVTALPAITGTVTANQGTSPWVVSGNVTSTTPATVFADSTYEMNVARGLIPGQYQELKNGFATGIPASTEITIWNQTTLYPWSSWITAQPLYIVSTSAADVGQVLRIEGLDTNYNKITEDVMTTGVTPVATTQNFLRLNRVYIISGNANVGTITERLVNGTGTVVGSMAVGFARNKGGFFTVPAGYTAYILYGDATQFRGGAGNIGGVIRMYVKPFGPGPFLNQFTAEVVNGQYRNEFIVPLAVPEKTDIDVRIIADGNGTQASCNWQMILIAN